MNFDYNNSGILVALTFRIDFENSPIFFSLTPNIDGVLAAMKSSNAPKSLCNHEQAGRVAWRIEKDWREAQLAKIESGLATPIQLLLPYAVTKDGSTFYERINAGDTKLLN